MDYAFFTPMDENVGSEPKTLWESEEMEILPYSLKVQGIGALFVLVFFPFSGSRSFTPLFNIAACVLFYSSLFTGAILLRLFFMGIVHLIFLGPPGLNEIAPESPSRRGLLRWYFPEPDGTVQKVFSINSNWERFFLFLVRFACGLGFLVACSNVLGLGFLPLSCSVDMMILAVISILLANFSKAWCVIDSGESVIRFTWTNPIGRSRMEIPFEGIACLAVKGSMEGFPFLLNRFSYDYSIVLVTKGGEVVPFTAVPNPIPESPEKAFRYVFQVASKYSLELGLPLLPADVCIEGDRRSGAEGIRGFHFEGVGAEKGARILQDLQASTLLWNSPNPGQIHLEVSTWLEKTILGILTVFFLVSTAWMVVAKGTMILSHPRLLYLLLLDSGSCLVSILWLGKNLLDQHYILDLNQREIRFRSRILLASNEETVTSFDEIREVRVVEEPWAPFKLLPRCFGDVLSEIFGYQYSVVLSKNDGSDITLSETLHSNEGIPWMWGNALKKMVRRQSSPRTETAQDSAALNLTETKRPASCGFQGGTAVAAAMTR